MLDFKAKVYHVQFPLGLRGSAPEPAKELTALPRTLAVFKGPTCEGRRRWEGKGKRSERGGAGRGGRGREEGV